MRERRRSRRGEEEHLLHDRDGIQLPNRGPADPRASFPRAVALTPANGSQQVTIDHTRATVRFSATTKFSSPRVRIEGRLLVYVRHIHLALRKERERERDWFAVFIEIRSQFLSLALISLLPLRSLICVKRGGTALLSLKSKRRCINPISNSVGDTAACRQMNVADTCYREGKKKWFQRGKDPGGDLHVDSARTRHRDPPPVESGRDGR